MQKSNHSNDSGKIYINYYVAIAYASFIVIASVLVGVLSALVNPPECSSDNSVKLGQKIDAHTNNFREDKSTYDLLKYLFKNPKSSFLKELERCEELNQPTNGQFWESMTLPKNIVPITYDIKLYTPVFVAESYSGEIRIEIDVVEPTQFIILNAKFLSVYLASLYDAANNQIELACDGLFLPNDYYVLKTKNELFGQKYLLDLYFTGNLNVFSSGIFEIKYNNDDQEFDGSMLASHFEPLDARKGYPCFDEPQLKANYVIEIYHPNGTQALSNWPVESESVVNDGEILTVFKQTPRLPSYLIGLTAFNKSDFDFKQKMTDQNIPVRFWARKNYIENGLVDDPLQMTVDLFNSLEKIFSDSKEAIPPKIDVFAIPFYPQEAVPHSGLILFEENKVLFKKATVQERVRQSITLEMAKLLSEFWFGNYMTFEWWSELWLQETIADYMKYKVVDRTYPDWRVYDQFITEELIQVLTEDSYPSSHPVIKQVNSPTEIDELFDDIESSKGAAILRMMEYEIGSYDFMIGIKNYLKQSQNGIGKPDKLWEALDNIRNWPAKDFAERWFTQANYPFVNARINKKSDGKFYIDINQERFKSDYSIFSNEDLYPTVFNYTWYIPLRCVFGRTAADPEPMIFDFQIETKQFSQIIGDGNVEFNWFHCDERFAGYYLLDYSQENWENLGFALKQRNEYLEASDRSNLIHNLFINTFNGKTSYKILTDFLSYLPQETEYLPWKTVHKHVSDLAAVLEYRRSFYPVSQYFVTMLQEIEHSSNIWEASTNHVEELKREIILELSCRMLDSYCLKNVTSLWPQAFNSLISSTNPNTLAPHVKQIVYNYHLQNSYSINEWQTVFLEYETLEDIQEREMLLEAISYSRLPSLLSKFLLSVSSDQFRREDYFDVIRFLGKNPIGREIAWDFYRSKFVEINTLFGFENVNIGKMLLYIASTFSDEFMYFELLKFIYSTQSGASQNARLRCVEIVSTNLIWIVMKEEEIIKAFTGGRMNDYDRFNNTGLIDLKLKLLNAYEEKSGKKMLY